MTEAVGRGRRRWRGTRRGAATAATDSAQETAELDLPDDGLAAELAASAGRRWWNRWTIYLGAVVLLLAGFVVGVQVQKSYGDSRPGGLAGGRGQQRGNGGAFPGFTGGGRGGLFGGGQPSGAPRAGNPAGPGGAANPAGPGAAGSAAAGGAETSTGTVKLVDGTTIYVQLADGTVLTVRTSAETDVKVAKSGSLKDIKAGDSVTVQGANSAGTVTATSVTGQAK